MGLNQPKPILHGRDHLPGGADPIPATAPAPAPNTEPGYPSLVTWPLLSPSHVAGNVTLGSTSGIQYVGLDSNLPSTPAMPTRSVLNNFRRDFYGTVGARTPNQNDYLITGARLGPQHSIWEFVLSYVTGPDFGRIHLQMATLTENADGTVTPIDWTTINWIDTGYLANCYTTNPGVSTNTFLGAIRLKGAPGAQATTLNHTPQFPETDGGPGLWLFRWIVTDKAASSTGYKAAIYELFTGRITTGFGLIG